MSRAERLRIIGEVYDAWERDWVSRVEYLDLRAEEPEAAVLLNASPEAEDDLERRTAAALTAAGLPVAWTPTENTS
ncbi:MAG: hypothetical protein ACT4P1_11070 [Sporichthyaceae bacterium]